MEAHINGMAHPGTGQMPAGPWRSNHVNVAEQNSMCPAGLQTCDAQIFAKTETLWPMKRSGM